MGLVYHNDGFYCSDKDPYVDFEEVLYRDSFTNKCVIDMSTYYPTPGSCWYSIYCSKDGVKGGFQTTQITPIPLSHEQLKACRDELKHDVKHFRTCH